MLNVDLTFKVLRTGKQQALISRIVSLMHSISETVLQAMHCCGHDRNRMEALLLNQIVLTKYNNRTYRYISLVLITKKLTCGIRRVDRIDFDQTPRSTFEKKRAKGSDEKMKISYAEYYETFHNQRIRDLSQPLLVSEDRKKRGPKGKEGNYSRKQVSTNFSTAEDASDKLIYLIPELCQLTGISEEMRSDHHIMQDVHKVTLLSNLFIM